MTDAHAAGSVMSNDRQRIGQTILNACRGARSEDALLAQIDALATCIGALHHLCGDSLAEAEAVAIEAGDMILQHVRKNWGEIEVAQ
ncbi:MAG: hypothetical protein WBA15_08970 [Mesorhizobium sp.]